MEKDNNKGDVMKNIAIIIPSLKAGGAERAASNLSRSLEKKYNVYLIIFDGNKKNYSHGGKLIDLNIPAASNNLIRILNLFKRIYKIKKIKKALQIQVAISFMYGPNIVNMLSKTTDKTILSVRAHLSKGVKKSKTNKYIRKRLYNKADQVVGVSRGVTKDLVDNFGINKEILSSIYNPIDINKIQKKSYECLSNEEKKLFSGFTVITVGRLVHAKGHWHLIRAMKKVTERIKDVKLIIIGDGYLKDYLKQLVSDLNLQNNIFFLGSQKNVFKYVSKADIFVMSSLYEGFPNAIIEAMACRVPIISTDCQSGPREILAPKTDFSKETSIIEYASEGILVPVLDGIKYNSDDCLTKEENMLADSIIKLYEDSDLRSEYIKKSVKRAKQLDVHIITPKWEKLIEYV